MLTHTAISSLLIAAAALAWGCSKKEEPAAQSQPVEQAPAEVAAAAPAENPKASARTMFKTRCAVCHGESGKGDGAGAAALVPKPRNYTDAEWQKTVTDEQIKQTILMGGAAVGKSPIMPASPDLNEKPEVVTELVAIIRGFAGK